MTPEEWRRVRAVFDAAVEREDAERGAFLEQACGGDIVLRASVESLLRADQYPAGGLDAPAAVTSALAEDGAAEALLGTRLGDYEIARVLGHGGMGVVYEAVRADDQFRKRVAVKLIKRGMDSAFVLQRFRQEREILAALDHPGIARLLDAGTAADGRPYVVMEYVSGRPIDRYCAEEKLGVDARLRLFCEVCAAVAYAHRSLVVHRDLKPANILVSGEGTPRLLDFGLAKLLDPTLAGESTATGLLLMTPEYASPEQVRGERVGTATDVYSLGVLLYELLTGTRPYALASRLPGDVRRAVCDTEPRRPSAAVGRRDLARALRGDLDNIVQMALRKEPERRYASADQLAEDLRRHLDNRPVLARPDTFGYRSGRWVRRNKLATAAVVLLVGWVATATWQAHIARQERARAQRRFEDVRRLANTFLFDFHDAIAEVPGTTKARELVVRSAVQYLGALAAEAEGDPGLQRELGLAYLRLGQATGGVGVASLGDQKGALAHFQTGVALLERAYAAQPQPALAGDLADAHRRLARGLSGQVRFDEAGRHLQSARDLAAVAAAGQGRVEDVLRQAAIEQLSADWHSDRSEWNAAEQSLRAGLAMLRGLAPDAAARADVRRLRLTLTIRLGDALGQLGRPDQSLAVLDDLIGDLTRPGAPVVQEQRMLALLHGMAGTALDDLGRSTAAVERFDSGRRVLDEMRRGDPANYQASKDLTLTLALQCGAATNAGENERAREACRSGLALAEGLAHEHPGQAGVVDALGLVCMHNGKLALAEQRYADAERFFRRVTADQPAPGDGVALRQLAAAHGGLADVMEKSGRRPEAVVEARRALEILEQARAGAPREPSVLKDTAGAQARLGRLLLRLAAGRQEGADLVRSALGTFEALQQGGMTHRDVAREVQALGRDLVQAGLAPPPVSPFTSSRRDSP